VSTRESVPKVPDDPQSAKGTDLPTERRAATIAEARALSNPVRLRILRLCLNEALTNKELATRLDLHPGTVLHHVRNLVATGFLTEDPPRPGPRGTTEKPYRATGKSWRLDVEESEEGPAVRRAVLDAVAAELDEAGPGAVIESARMAMRLRPQQLKRLQRRLQELTEEFAQVDEPDGEPVAMLIMLHRRPAPAPAKSTSTPANPVAATPERKGRGRDKPGHKKRKDHS
jgi:DNA-binding transcriptional ArsR family regulator